MIPLAQERAHDPIAVTRVRGEMRAAVADRPPEVREVAVLVPAIERMVPAHEMEQLVAGRKLDLPQPFIGLDAGRELDLVAIGIEAASASRIRPDDPAAAAQRTDVVGEAA